MALGFDGRPNPILAFSHQAAFAVGHGDDDGPGRAVGGGEDLENPAIAGQAQGHRRFAMIFAQQLHHLGAIGKRLLGMGVAGKRDCADNQDGGDEDRAEDPKRRSKSKLAMARLSARSGKGSWAARASISCG